MTNFDIRQLHPYNGGSELPKILQFVGECNILANFCGCLHPGDICHYLSNSLRGRDLEQHFHVYEEVDGQILGLVMLYSAILVIAVKTWNLLSSPGVSSKRKKYYR